MPLNGSGTYTPPTPEYPAIPNTTIEAGDWNAIIEDLSTALSLALYKDGQATMAANFSMGNYKIVSLATGTANTDAVNFLQVFTDPTFTGVAGTGVKITGTTFTCDATTVNWSNTNYNLTCSGTFTFTGVSSFPTQAITDNSTKVATTAFAQQLAFNAALPAITGATDYVITNNGSIVSWSQNLKATVIRLVDGTDTTKKVALDISPVTTGTTRTLAVPNANTTLVGTDVAQILTNKTINQSDSLFILQDNSDATKQARFELSEITAGNTRVATLADRNITLDTPAMRWLQSVTASNSATLDITGFDSSKYSDYIIIISGMDLGTTNADLLLQLTIGGTLRTTNYYHHTNISNHTAATYAGLNGSNVSAITLADDLGNKPDTTPGLDIHLYLFDIANTAKYPMVKWVGASSMPLAVGFKEASGAGGNSNLGAITTVRLLASSGNIKDGTAHLYGIRRS
jgi:hypothetical protein